ncbi:MAG: hypothetical protein ACFFAJ_18435 [Candidatus Hodarchaeota archaeon]
MQIFNTRYSKTEILLIALIITILGALSFFIGFEPIIIGAFLIAILTTPLIFYIYFKIDRSSEN